MVKPPNKDKPHVPVPKPPPVGEIITQIQLERICNALESIAVSQKEIASALQGGGREPEAKDFQLVQLKGEKEMPGIDGVPAGSTRLFKILLVPGNAAPLQSGPTASSDNAGVHISPDPQQPDNPFVIMVSVDQSVTDESFNLNVEGVSDRGNPISHGFVIPIPAAEAPEAVDFDLEQLTLARSSIGPAVHSVGRAVPARGLQPQPGRPGGRR